MLVNETGYSLFFSFNFQQAFVNNKINLPDILTEFRVSLF